MSATLVVSPKGYQNLLPSKNSFFFCQKFPWSVALSTEEFYFDYVEGLELTETMYFNNNIEHQLLRAIEQTIVKWKKTF